MDRNENESLKDQFENLRRENVALKKLIRNPNDSIKRQITRLRDELIRVNDIAENLTGKPVSKLVNQIKASMPSSSSGSPVGTTGVNANNGASSSHPVGPTGIVDIPMTGKNRLNGLMELVGAVDGSMRFNKLDRIDELVGINFDETSNNNPMDSLMGLTQPVGVITGNGVSKSGNGLNGLREKRESGKTGYNKKVYKQAAITAVDELVELSPQTSSLWHRNLDVDEYLNFEEYSKKFLPFMETRLRSFVVDATRDTATVFITSAELVATMMYSTRWKAMFPCMVRKAETIEILFAGENGTHDGELQLMYVEIVFPSPFVQPRQEKFLRFAKHQSTDTWVVVDFPLDMAREASYTNPSTMWTRRPSGCVVKDVANGFSTVTWIEHTAYDPNRIHVMFRSLLKSGLAFGAQRWLNTLLRERDFLFMLASSKSTAGEFTKQGKRSITRLMKRVSNSLSFALSASPSPRWEKVQSGNFAADVSIVSHVSINKPGEPSGLVLSASTSFWLPIRRKTLFDLLRDEKERGKWDILTNGGPMNLICSFFKDQDKTKIISLLCPPAVPQSEQNMLILQESWTNKTSSFIAYAPVDLISLQSILEGADSDYLPLLPSGFSITDAGVLPDAPDLRKYNDSHDYRASVLTMGFQVLVSSSPLSTLTVESIQLVSSLMCGTIKKIAAAAGVDLPAFYSCKA